MYQSSHVYQDCTNSVPTVHQALKTVKNSQKTVKTAKKTIGVPIVTSSHVYQDCTNSVPIVKNRQKQSKDSQNSKKDHWCTNRHMSTQSPPNTQSRANAATLRNLHHMCLGSGHSPSPVGRADCMCLHGRACVLLPFAAACCYTSSLLPTDDACSSSCLSTTVIEFSIFSDPTRKLSAVPPELRRIR